MSDIDEIEQWQAQKESNLARKAGIQSYSDDLESEEEVMGIEDDEEANWGKSKANYYGGADDQGDESAQEDEEEEALKLQERMAKEMDEQDFLDEDDEEGWRKDASEGEEELEQTHDLSNMDASARLALLHDAYPEVLLLAKELEKCKAAAQELEEQDGDVIEIKKTSLNSYMAMIYSYYALFTAQVQTGSVDLKEHPVMEGILKARELWRLASRLGVDDLDENSEEDPEGDLEEEVSGEEFGEVGEDIELDSQGEPIEQSDLDDEDEDASDASDSDSADEFTIAMPSNKRRRSDKKVVSDFNETADSVEQQARIKNKQSLRFYTSTIDKRNAPREDKFGGDLDLPYQERAFERRKRLQEEARLRGLETKDRLGEDSDEDVEQDSSSRGGSGGSSSNPLYNRAKAAISDKKADRELKHKAAVENAMEERTEKYNAENGKGGKRAISYQIQKNRGLTTKRAKINRNARLKKRVRYEEAKKKLRGVRKEYKAPTGAYAGESKGIRKNVVHSTKF